MRRASALALAALTAGCAMDVNPVQLRIDADATGLSCVDSRTGAPLVTNARVEAGEVFISFVVDYLEFDGVPSCRPIELLEWCGARGCPARRRDCREVRLPAPMGGLTVEEAGEEILRALREGGPVTDDAPDGVVLVRVAVTNETCATAAPAGEIPRLRCADLLGCLYSCPVQLDEVRGEIELELDALGDRCDEAAVGVCAGIGHGAPIGCAP